MSPKLHSIIVALLILYATPITGEDIELCTEGHCGGSCPKQAAGVCKNPNPCLVIDGSITYCNFIFDYGTLSIIGYTDEACTENPTSYQLKTGCNDLSLTLNDNTFQSYKFVS